MMGYMMGPKLLQHNFQFPGFLLQNQSKYYQCFPKEFWHLNLKRVLPFLLLLIVPKFLQSNQ